MKASSSRSDRGARRGGKRIDRQRCRKVLAREAAGIRRRLKRAVKVNPDGRAAQDVQEAQYPACTSAATAHNVPLDGT